MPYKTFLCYFSWVDISNVINHKRDFTIESVIGSDKAEFHFSDVESAKNAWRFCVLQHMFFREYEMDSNLDQTDKGPPLFQQSNVDVSITFKFTSIFLYIP